MRGLLIVLMSATLAQQPGSLNPGTVAARGWCQSWGAVVAGGLFGRLCRRRLRRDSWVPTAGMWALDAPTPGIPWRIWLWRVWLRLRLGYPPTTDVLLQPYYYGGYGCGYPIRATMRPRWPAWLYRAE